MSTHEKVARLLGYAPRPAEGYHIEAHLEPDVIATLRQENVYGLCRVRFDTTKSPVEITLVPIVEDPSAVYAEFHIVPDRFRPGGVFERVERWRRAHA